MIKYLVKEMEICKEKVTFIYMKYIKYFMKSYLYLAHRINEDS